MVHEKMYSLDEVGLIPARISNVKHRGDVNPFTKKSDVLPVFVSPMTCIIDETNISKFLDNKFIPIVPVSARWSFSERMGMAKKTSGWAAFTLEEFKNYYPVIGGLCKGVLIDTANGQMEELFTLVKECKKAWGNSVKIMTGNIANPETYLDCCLAGVDYVRVGIGGGSGCTTSVQTGIHTSIPYILKGINRMKTYISNCESSASIGLFEYNNPEVAALKGFRTKVVADGGITSISRAIKALALGADYVMMGKLFAQCEEAAITLKYTYSSKSSDDIKKEALYYGQSSEQGQLNRFGKIKSYPEGTELWIPVTTNLKDFSHAFESSLRSAMSYCNANTLEEFIGNVDYEIMSKHEFDSYNK